MQQPQRVGEEEEEEGSRQEEGSDLPWPFGTGGVFQLLRLWKMCKRGEIWTGLGRGQGLERLGLAGRCGEKREPRPVFWGTRHRCTRGCSRLPLRALDALGEPHGASGPPRGHLEPCLAHPRVLTHPLAVPWRIPHPPWVLGGAQGCSGGSPVQERCPKNWYTVPGTPRPRQSRVGARLWPGEAQCSRQPRAAVLAARSGAWQEGTEEPGSKSSRGRFSRGSGSCRRRGRSREIPGFLPGSSA